MVLSPPGDHSVSELGGQEGEDLGGAVGAGPILLEPVLPPGGHAPDGRPHHCLQHVEVGGPVDAPLKPGDGEDLAVHDPDPGHHLGAVGFLAGHHFIRILRAPGHIVFPVGGLVQDKPFLI